MAERPKELNMIIAAAVSVAVFIALAFFLGRGCQPGGEEPAATVTVTASTATATQPATGTQPESTGQPAPAAPAEPEPAVPTPTEESSPTAAPLSIADASWSCDNYSSDPDNEGC